MPFPSSTLYPGSDVYPGDVFTPGLVDGQTSLLATDGQTALQALIDSAYVSVTGVVDDFEDGVLNPMWQSFGVITEANGRLRTTVIPAYSAIHQGPLDLTNREVVIELAIPPNPLSPQIDTYLWLFDFDNPATNNNFAMNLLSNKLFFIVGGTTATEVPWDHGQLRHWRFRHSGTTWHAETSPDRVTWTTRRSFAHAGVNPARVRIEIGTGKIGGPDPADHPEWDNFAMTIPTPRQRDGQTTAPTTDGHSALVGAID